MTRTPFDHFAKALMLAHESARGRAETELELPGESVFVDLAWTPAPSRSRRPPRDVIDRMASRLSLWEFFHKPPTLSEHLACVHERETLLLRLMGAGTTLMRAIDDLAALPEDAHERIITMPELHHIYIASPEDASMKVHDKIMQTVQKLIDEHERTLAEKARNEGIKQGLSQGIERGIERGLSQGLAPLVRQASRKLGRALTDDERRTLTARLDTLGPDRLGDAVLDLSADELARWIADAAAR